MDSSTATYVNFDVKITHINDSDYLAQVTQSPVGQSQSNRFTAPFTGTDIAQLVLFIESGTTDGAAELPRKYGTILYEQVFSEQMRDQLQRSFDLVRKQGQRLRMRLMLAEAQELHQIPWEYLYSSAWDRFIATSTNTPIVRYLEMSEPETSLTVTLPAKMLVVIANPTDTTTLDVEGEWSKISNAVQPLVTQGVLTIERLAVPTIAALYETLSKRGAAYHILHIIAHGTFDETQQRSMLVFETAERTTNLVDGAELATVLSDHPTLRLVVLNACRSAQTGVYHNFGGVAQTLIRQGIPAVVAMQYPLSDAVAKLFTSQFYAAIFDTTPIDEAISTVRKSLFISDHRLEWGTPVLFMRSLDGVLFRNGDHTPAPAAVHVEPTPVEPEPEPAEQSESVTLATEQPLICANCQTESPAGTAFCPKCGTQLGMQPLICPNCQTESPADTAFCPKCGTQLTSNFHVLQPENIANLKHFMSFTGHEKGVNRLAISPDTAVLISGSNGLFTQETHPVRVWALDQMAQIATLDGETLGTYALAFVPNTWNVLVVSFQMITEYDLQNGTIRWQQPFDIGFGKALEACSYSPDGQQLAIGADDDLIHLWDMRSRQEVATLAGHTNDVIAVAFLGDGGLLVSGSSDNTVRVWDTAARQQIRQVTATNSITALAITNDSQHVVAGDYGGKIYMWSLPDLQPIVVLDSIKSTIKCLAISQDNRLLAVCYDQMLRVIDMETKQTLNEFQAHNNTIKCVAFAPNGNCIATGSDDQTINIWVVTP